MSSSWRRLAVVCALSLAALACDEARGPTTAPPPAKPSEPEAEAPTPEAGAGEATSAEPEPEPEPEPPPGPSCDRRGSGGQGPANHTCIDYGEHRGALEPRCAEGVELGEAGCPEAELVARCTLPATGVRFFYYEGVELAAAARECATLDGDYASPAAP